MIIFSYICILGVISIGLSKSVTTNEKYTHDIRSIVLKLSIILSVFLIILLITNKIISSTLFVLSVELVLIIVSNTKFNTLKEPLVFTDIILYSQVFKFPRLYIPFLSFFSFLGIIVITISMTSLFIIDHPILLKNKEFYYLFSLLIILVIISFIISLNSEISLDPDKDIGKYSLINCLYIYSIKKLSNQIDPEFESPYNTIGINKSCRISGSIVCIQSESFFDARRMHPSIKKNILEKYDEIKSQSHAFGHLNVPAWGANTMRTEFSFLTGIPNNDLGLDKFYPHYSFRKKKIKSIVSFLKESGYKTICIHPHPANFFRRKQLFSNLGFDEFIDIEEFSASDKFGPYISDEAVTKKIIDTLDKSTQTPLFIYVITMENHGPLHLEAINPSEIDSYFDHPIDFDGENLGIYLRHLKNSDRMVNTLINYLEKKEGNNSLCFYGDHIPSMPTLYSELNFDDDRTDYFIWKSTKTKLNVNRDLKVESLGKLLLQEADMLAR